MQIFIIGNQIIIPQNDPTHIQGSGSSEYDPHSLKSETIDYPEDLTYEQQFFSIFDQFVQQDRLNRAQSILIETWVQESRYFFYLTPSSYSTNKYHQNPYRIMNPCPQPEPDEKFSQFQQQTTETKTFLQDIFKVNYINTSKIVYRLGSHSTDVKVNNYLCHEEDQNLYKITQIIYQDRLIRIQDKFQVCLDGDQVLKSCEKIQPKQEKEDKKWKRNVEKVRMFNKNASKQNSCEKRDKKNIVKNVIKIFHTWLDKKSEKYSNSALPAMQKLQKLLQVQNYNNRLIKKIAESNQISRQFMKFLVDDAYDEIKYSRIQDKQSHYEALQIYKELLEDNHIDDHFKQEVPLMHSEPVTMGRGIFEASSPNKLGKSVEQINFSAHKIPLRSKDKKNQKQVRNKPQPQRDLNPKQSSN